MNDLNGTALAALAAALAPHLAQHFGAGSQGNPTTQAGQTLGNPQTGGAVSTAFGGQQAQQTAGTAPAGGGMFGTAPAAQQQQPSVTPDMIQQLIMPLVQNEQIKGALTKQMQEMGIANLPDATAAQLPELYQRFKNVEEQARAAGLLGAPAGGTPSLI